MYQFNGTLNIKKIHGQYGWFAVGSIETPIGQFKVKQSELDQYDQGSYEGNFTISNISARASNFGTGALILETVANLIDININAIDENAVMIDAVEQDPIETANVATTEVETEVKPKVKSAKLPNGQSNAKDLFNDKQLIEITKYKDVKLDPAVGAKLFRSQVKFLQGNNYTYHPKNAIWLCEDK